jgi:hypothetical protein
MALDSLDLDCQLMPGFPSSRDHVTHVLVVHPVRLNLASNGRHIVQTHIALAQASVFTTKPVVVGTM